MTFGAHNSFYLRDGWIYKILENWRDKENLFALDDAPIILGVGKNMVNALRFWGLATEVIGYDRGHNSYWMTDFGEMIYKHDPYLEMDETLWLIHVNLANNMEYSSTWYWVFNVNPYQTFSTNQFLDLVQPWIAREYQNLGISKSGVSVNTLKRDIQCFISTYTAKADMKNPDDNLSSPLAKLDLVEYNRGVVHLMQSSMVPELAFEYAVAKYLKYVDSESNGVQRSLWEITHDPRSPLKVLRLDHQQLYDRLTGLNQQGWKVKIERTAGIDSISFLETRKEDELIKKVFNG